MLVPAVAMVPPFRSVARRVATTQMPREDGRPLLSPPRPFIARRQRAVRCTVPAASMVAPAGLLSYDNFVRALAGAVGSGVSLSLFYPLDYARTAIQVDDGARSQGTLAVLRRLSRRDGVAGLYQGLRPMLVAVITSNFVYFYAYHAVKARVAPRSATGARMVMSLTADIALAALAGAM